MLFNDSCCVMEMFFNVQNKLHVNVVYFQFTAETGCTIKSNCLYVGLQFTQQNNLYFPFDNDHNTHDITQVNNMAI